jgi:hypothetical protein
MFGQLACDTARVASPKNSNAALAVGPAQRRVDKAGGQPRAGTFSFVRIWTPSSAAS